MELFNDYLKFCKDRINAKRNVIDLSKETFFRPITLLPLVAYIMTHNVKIIEPNDPKTKRYLKTIQPNSSTYSLRQNRTYLPVVHLPTMPEGASSVLQELYRIPDLDNFGGENAFKYLIGEIVDNIYEHSEFRHAFVMAQAFKKLGFMDVCFIDDGITINGSFQKSGIYSFDDSKAISEAVNGRSTKGDGRGFGLSSNVKLITEGAEGSFLIVSGRGYLTVTGKSLNRRMLREENKLDGTLVGVRIPYITSRVDIYRYIS